MKLPNRFGSVSKLSGNRRRPYIVRKIISYDVNKKPIYKTLGYFSTYEEAITFLVNHNKVKRIESSITLLEVFRRWLPIKEKEVAPKTFVSYKTTFTYLESISSIPVSEITYEQMQSCIDSLFTVKCLSYSTCKKARSLLSMLLDFANINNWCDTQHHNYIKLGKNIPVRPHTIFSRQQINKLWNMDTKEAWLILFLLYTGMRVSELLNLEKKDINLKTKIFKIKKSKTAAGVRIIPIHKRIFPIVEFFMKNDGDFLLQNNNNEQMSYASYSDSFKKVMKILRVKHTTHDCRHTFASLLDSAGANYNSKRALLGHKNGDITDRVYTHKTLKELRKTIHLLK